tara:strand:+ start:7189 stop:7914 length:726 start_codon:yes stop_codon:yes gene_type:complete
MVYNTDKFSHTRPNAGVTIAPFIYKEGEIKVLLYKRAKDAAVYQDVFCLPNRFFDITEFDTMEDAAHYALKEKTNVSISRSLVQFHAFSGKYIDPTRITTINLGFYSILRESEVSECLKNQPFETVWMKVEDALKLNLAFNHNEVLEMAYKKLKYAAEYTTSPIHFLDEKFTINELRELTEFLIDQKLDNSRYRSRIQSSGILIECEGEKVKKGSFRPSQLYTYNEKYTGCFYPKSVTSAR